MAAAPATAAVVVVVVVATAALATVPGDTFVVVVVAVAAAAPVIPRNNGTEVDDLDCVIFRFDFFTVPAAGVVNFCYQIQSSVHVVCQSVTQRI